MAGSWTATGGNITATGLFTAGSQPGKWKVVARGGGRSDTVSVTIAEPPSPLSPATASAKPERPTASRGIPFGAFHLPAELLGQPNIPYTATLWTVRGSTLRRQLETVRTAKRHILLAVPRSKSKDSRGRLSAAAVGEELARWRAAVDLDEYLKDGTVLGIYVTDEPNCASCWGGTRANQLQVDSMAMLAKRIWPEVVTFARVEPGWFKTPPQFLDAAWAQYNGPIRDGLPGHYRREQVAAAKARGLGLVLWMNTLDGGDGSSKIPGTFQNAAKVRRWQMTAEEVLHYGSVFLAEPYNCLALHWQWSPAFGLRRPFEQLDAVRAFDDRSDVRVAMDSLATLAAERPASSCRRR
ncbi:MAG: hypothetical protein ACREMX_14215 [Gemmatimonadales bacterium]